MDEGWSVLAFDQNTGKIIWGTKHEWNASYSSPIIATLQGKPRLLVLQGGESDPAFGGLLCIDPNDGTLHDAFAWRPDKYESVNGAAPVAVGGDRIFITTSYQLGATMLQLNEDLKWEQLWEAPMFGIHWMTPIAVDGTLYGFRGRNEPDAWLAAYDVETGKETLATRSTMGHPATKWTGIPDEIPARQSPPSRWTDLRAGRTGNTWNFRTHSRRRKGTRQNTAFPLPLDLVTARTSQGAALRFATRSRYGG